MNYYRGNWQDVVVWYEYLYDDSKELTISNTSVKSQDSLACKMIPLFLYLYLQTDVRRNKVWKERTFRSKA